MDRGSILGAQMRCEELFIRAELHGRGARIGDELRRHIPTRRRDRSDILRLDRLRRAATSGENEKKRLRALHRVNAFPSAHMGHSEGVQMLFGRWTSVSSGR